VPVRRMLKSPLPWLFAFLLSLGVDLPRVLNRHHYASRHIRIRVAAAITALLVLAVVIRIIVLAAQLVWARAFAHPAMESINRPMREPETVTTRRQSRPLRYCGVNIPSDETDPDLAPWWRRAVASLLDSLILIGLEEVLFLAVAGHGYFARHLSSEQRLVRLLLLAITGMLYYAPLMRLTNGRTPGKLLLGIRVVRTDGENMTMVRAIWRQVVLLIVLPNIAVLIGYGLGYLVSAVVLADLLWPLWDTEKRALHDMAAGTRVRWARGEA
jgi:uncharacterized RDD family membrane protein YckC